jgi:hypothetical protein
MLPPNSPAEAITTLRQAIVSLSKDSDFNAEAMKVMAVSTRFEVGEQGERLFQKVSQTSPKIVISSVSTSTR